MRLVRGAKVWGEQASLSNDWVGGGAGERLDVRVCGGANVRAHDQL